MEYTNKLRQNIFKNYIFAFLTSFNLTHGTWMIYLAIKGMSLLQLGILEGIFHVTSFLMEVPTGAVADIWGRKVSRICGRVFSVISVVILIFSNSFFFFALSFVFTALSYNLESGAGEALVYDSLKEIGEENKYMKLAGTQEVFLQLGMVAGLILGGIIATKSYIYAYSLSAIIGIVALIQAFTFTEPNTREVKRKEESTFSVLKNQVLGSIKILKENRKIGFFIIFLQSISVFLTSIFFYIQNYMKGTGYNEGQIGLVLAISAVAGAIVASQAHRIEKVFKEKGILIIMPIIASLSIWGIALTKYYFAFFVVLTAVEGIIFIVINDYINKLIPSEKRATILSMASMVFSLMMIIVFPIVGQLGDMFSLKLAFKILAIASTSLVVPHVYFVLRKDEKKELA